MWNKNILEILKSNKLKKTAMLTICVTFAISLFAITNIFALTKAMPLMPQITDEQSNAYLNNGETLFSEPIDLIVAPEEGATYYYLFTGFSDTVKVYYDGETNNPVGSYFDGSLENGALVTTLGDLPDSTFGTIVGENEKWKISMPELFAGEETTLKIIAYKGNDSSEVFSHTFTNVSSDFTSVIKDGKIVTNLMNGTNAEKKGNLILAVYNKADGTLHYSETFNFTVNANSKLAHTYKYDIDDLSDDRFTYKTFCADEKFAPMYHALTVAN